MTSSEKRLFWVHLIMFLLYWQKIPPLVQEFNNVEDQLHDIVPLTSKLSLVLMSFDLLAFLSYQVLYKPETPETWHTANMQLKRAEHNFSNLKTAPTKYHHLIEEFNKAKASSMLLFFTSWGLVSLQEVWSICPAIFVCLQLSIIV